MKRVLFVCSQNRLRSPTAEQIFSSRKDIEVSSAGTDHDARNSLDTEKVGWADIIFVMEKTHRNKILRKYRNYLIGKKLICLDIPDEYEFMEPALVRILEDRVPRHLL
ncbi:low molecular weight protein tyrosine phosphatase family protein [Allorhizobium taibaishanense]|uniref:low molecular weight protein tyrosine phosphatase family protein n=1 Tax=Allorhizobium taibaishanense TaxID=887144 RepID=UPI00094F6FA1|nr:low molecular weight protein tyrosine phosphatase family protein [Allorhizobium taibaishanense]